MELKNYFIKLNPLAKILFSSILLLGTAILITTIALNSPFYLENPWEPTEVNEIYTFKDWEIEWDYLTLNFSEGEVLMGYQQNELSGIVITGNGQYDISIPLHESRENKSFSQSGLLNAVYLPVTENSFDELKSDTIFKPHSSYSQELNYEKYFKAEKTLLASLDTFGVTRTIHPSSSNEMVYLFSENYEAKYYEGQSLVFSSNSGEKISLASNSDRIPYPPDNHYFFTISYLLLSLILLLILVYILTVDIPKSEHSSLRVSHNLFAILFTILGLFFLELVTLEFELSELDIGIFYFVMSCVLVTIHFKIGGSLNQIGVSSYYIPRIIIVTLFISIIIVGLGALRVPSSISINYLPPFITVILPVVLSILLQELVLRGVLLESLERVLGDIKGLLTSIGLIGLVNLSVLLITGYHQSFGFNFNSVLQVYE